MNWLKSLFSGLKTSNRRPTVAPVPPVVREPIGYCEHMRHWYFLEEKGEIFSVLDELLNQLFQLKTSKGLEFDGRFHVMDNRGHLMLSALTDLESILSAYPYDDTGFGWPLVVHEISPWPNGIEGQITASCHGAKVCLFDTLFFRNRKKYDAGKATNFLVNALAYKISISTPHSGFSDDFCAYFPVNTDDGGGQDEVSFMTKIEAIETFAFWGIPMVSLTVTLAKPNDFPMRLKMHAPASILPGDLKVGDRIQGYAWLFGFAKD